MKRIAQARAALWSRGGGPARAPLGYTASGQQTARRTARPHGLRKRGALRVSAEAAALAQVYARQHWSTVTLHHLSSE